MQLTRMLRLLDSYLEFQAPANLKATSNTQSPSTTVSAVPVTFPESYPFALLSNLPKNVSGVNTSSAESKAVYNSGLGETAIVILALALSSTRKHFLSFLENIGDIEGREHLTNLLLRLFRVASSILNNDAFPANWLNVNILAHKVLLKIMDPIASLLERDFIPTEQSNFTFDQVLWRDGFGVLLKLLSSEQLVIEEFSPQVSLLLACSSQVKITSWFSETSCSLEARWRYSWGRSGHTPSSLECAWMAG